MSYQAKKSMSARQRPWMWRQGWISCTQTSSSSKSHHSPSRSRHFLWQPNGIPTRWPCTLRGKRAWEKSWRLGPNWWIFWSQDKASYCRACPSGTSPKTQNWAGTLHRKQAQRKKQYSPQMSSLGHADADLLSWSIHSAWRWGTEQNGCTRSSCRVPRISCPHRRTLICR